MRQFSLAVLGAALAVVALTCVVYEPALRGDFVYDDAYYVRDNPFLKSADGLRRIWLTTEFPDYFALSTTSFWLEWRLWGNNPLGYHLTNISLHIVNALLLWLLLSRLRVPGAYLAALVFALHPVNVESVAWISERKNLLSLCFALLSTLSFLRWDDETKRPAWYVASLAGFAFALLSKTAVVMLPCVLLVLLWWRHNSVSRQQLLAVLPFFVLSAAMGSVAMWFDAHHSVAGEVVRHDSLLARLAGAGWVAWFYVAKAIWPVSLSVIYPRWRLDPSSALVWVPLATFGVTCLSLAKNRAAIVAVLCYVTLLFPFLGFFDISFMAYSYVADHWAYVALIPVMALVCAGAARLSVRSGWTHAVVFIILILLGVNTWRQSHVWHDEETLWRDTLRKNPLAWMAHNNLGNVLLAQGHTDAAVAEYRQTIALRPDYANAHYNLGIVNFRRGDFDEAAKEFREAARLKPKSAEAHNNLGAALANLGRTNDAIAEFETASALAPTWEEPRNNVARLR